jgi:hypothetical protein
LDAKRATKPYNSFIGLFLIIWDRIGNSKNGTPKTCS